MSAAVEEQAATTAEISRNVQEASVGTREVARNTVSVREAASETDRVASEMAASAGDLAHQSATLRSEVDRYLHSARAV